MPKEKSASGDTPKEQSGVELYVTSQGAWGIKDKEAFYRRDDVRKSFATASRIVKQQRVAKAKSGQ